MQYHTAFLLGESVSPDSPANEGMIVYMNVAMFACAVVDVLLVGDTTTAGWVQDCSLVMIGLGKYQSGQQRSNNSWYQVRDQHYMS